MEGNILVGNNVANSFLDNFGLCYFLHENFSWIEIISFGRMDFHRLFRAFSALENNLTLILNVGH